MKHLFNILTLALFLLVAGVSNAGVIVIEGHYQNRNIYIQNSYSYSGVGFCTFEVLVNGRISTDEINSTAFEIDLAQFQLELGAPVMIEIKYKDDGCSPKVLNPDALLPNPTFETTGISIDKNGLLQWTTKNETASLTFIIEQFKWNKWVQIGQVEGVGKPHLNDYTFQTTPHAGSNKYRIKQKGFIDKTRYSPSVSYNSLKPEVTYIYNKKKQMIEFAEESSFEVFNKFGELVKKGYANHINVSNLSRDTYYMNFGNTTAEFKKK